MRRVSEVEGVTVSQPPTSSARHPGEGFAATSRHARCGAWLTIVLMVLCVFTAPTAAAAPTDSLRAAVAAARGSACAPLRPSSVIDRAAAEINETTDRWINNTSRAVPETDALTPLRDLGYEGSKATILSGAARSDGDAIKAAVLQGFAQIPDCSWTEFGVHALYNAKKDMILTTIVLAA